MKLGDRRAGFVAGALIAVLALVVHRPWTPTALQMGDLMEALPYYEAHPDFISRFAALLRHFVVDEGRFNPLLLASMAAQWTAFEWNATGWVLVAFALMVANALASFHLMRRIGISVVGAFVGGAIVVVGRTARDLWSVGLYYSEPLVMLFVIIGALVATRYSRVRRWRLAGVAVAACIVLATLTKETAIACAPFVVALGLCYDEGGGWHLPRFDGRSIWLVGVTAALSLIAVVPIIATRIHAASNSYGGQYALGNAGVEVPFRILAAPVIPLSGAMPGSTGALDLLVATVVIIALARRGLRDRGARIAITVGALLPLAGAAIYAPWYTFRADYAYPFSLAASMWFGFAIDGCRDLKPWIARAAYVLGAAAFVVAARDAHRATGRAFGMREANGAVVNEILRANATGASRAVLLIDTSNPWERWFAGAAGRVVATASRPRSLVVSVLSCDAASTAIGRSANTIIATIPSNCESTPWSRPPDSVIWSRWRYVSWRRGIAVDSVAARLWRGPLERRGSLDAGSDDGRTRRGEERAIAARR